MPIVSVDCIDKRTYRCAITFGNGIIENIVISNDGIYSIYYIKEGNNVNKTGKILDVSYNKYIQENSYILFYKSENSSNKRERIYFYQIQLIKDITPNNPYYIGDNGNWFFGDNDTGKPSSGIDGKDGLNGIDGRDGITPHIGDNGNWFIGDNDTGKPSSGIGKDGLNGIDGRDGITPHIGDNDNWFIGDNDTGRPSRGEVGDSGVYIGKDEPDDASVWIDTDGVADKPSGGNVSDAAKSLLINILRNALFTNDMSSSITVLEEALGINSEINPPIPPSTSVKHLRYIEIGEGAYIDTGITPNNVGYRYVIGIQVPEVAKTVYYAGVNMQDKPKIAESNYLPFVFYFNVNSVEKRKVLFSHNLYGYQDFGKYTLSTGEYSSGNYESMTNPMKEPIYLNIANGNQDIWLDENCSIPVISGAFSTKSQSSDFTTGQYYDEDKLPIKSIWLGKINVTGLYSSNNSVPQTGVKFFCFRVYDENGVMIANMKPAEKDGETGMYDDVRKEFYPNSGTGELIAGEEVL